MVNSWSVAGHWHMKDQTMCCVKLKISKKFFSFKLRPGSIMRESEENSPLKNLKFQDYAYFSYADTVVFF